jgi:hypothetical protein
MHILLLLAFVSATLPLVLKMPAFSSAWQMAYRFYDKTRPHAHISVLYTARQALNRQPYCQTRTAKSLSCEHINTTIRQWVASARAKSQVHTEISSLFSRQLVPNGSGMQCLPRTCMEARANGARMNVKNVELG